MSSTDLQKAVESSLAAAAGATPGSERLQALARELSAHPELAIFNEKMQLQGRGWSRATYEGLAFWLVGRAANVGEAQATADLVRYLNATEVPHCHIFVFGGVIVQEPVAVGDGIVLLPFANLESRQWKVSLSQEYSRFHSDFQPSAVLEKPVAYPKAHGEPSEPATFEPDPYPNIRDVALLMTALGPSAPVYLGAWTEVDKWVPAVGGYSGAIPRVYDLGGFPRVPVTSDWAALPALYAAWRERSERERRHYRVPLKRLNASLRRQELVDFAIDLGIAIDALFLAEREPDRGELAFTLRLRAARFLEATEAGRREISRFFSILYNVSST